MILQLPRENTPVQPDILFNIGDFPFTNSMASQLVVTAIILLIAFAFYFKSKRNPHKPGRFAAAIELVVEGLESFFGQIAGDAKLVREILPIVGSLVLYIIISNLLTTIIPVMDAFRYGDHALFRLPTSDFNVTVGLAGSMVILSHLFSIRSSSILAHIGKYIKIKDVVVGFKNGVNEGFMAIITFLLGILDLVSEISKIISLSLRLFGNMFAGGLITGVLMSIFALFLPVPIALMGLLTALLQGIIFGALVTSYISLSTKE